MDPNSVTYDEAELEFESRDGDGNDGQTCWTLINGVRAVVDVDSDEDDDE